MKPRLKLGTKVRILWHKTNFFKIPTYADIGEVRGNFTSYDGTPYVELYNFHKYDKHYSLHFPMYTVRLLGEDIKDGDTL